MRERKHRLSVEFYCGKIVVAFTVCITDRKPIFNKTGVFNTLSQILLQSLNRLKCDAYVYLFMPDHCHFLIQGNSDDSNLLSFMKDFKQQSGYWFYKNISDVSWQKDFYDHILRKNEDINKQVSYILENPIRKGLVSNWKEYPFKGSTIYNFEDW